MEDVLARGVAFEGDAYCARPAPTSSAKAALAAFSAQQLDGEKVGGILNAYPFYPHHLRPSSVSLLPCRGHEQNVRRCLYVEGHSHGVVVRGHHPQYKRRSICRNSVSLRPNIRSWWSQFRVIRVSALRAFRGSLGPATTRGDMPASPRYI